MQRHGFIPLAIGAVILVALLGTGYQVHQTIRDLEESGQGVGDELHRLNKKSDQLRAALEKSIKQPCPECSPCPIPKPVAPKTCIIAQAEDVSPTTSNSETDHHTRPEGATEVGELTWKIADLDERLHPVQRKVAELDRNANLERKRVEARAQREARFVAREKQDQRESPDSYSAAGALYREGLNEKASEGRLAKLSQLVEEHPNSNRAATSAIQLALAYMETRDWESGIHYLEFALDSGVGAYFKDGIEVAPQALLYLGILEAKRGNGAAAEKHWERLLQSWPESTTHSGRPLTEIIESERSKLLGMEVGL